MRCLGTLEFLCDFYDRCHLTQIGFPDAEKKIAEPQFDEESCDESDKENASSPNDGRRKRKPLFAKKEEVNKKHCKENTRLSYKAENNGGNNINDDKNITSVNNSELVKTSAHLSNSVSDKQSPSMEKLPIKKRKTEDASYKENILKCEETEPEEKAKNNTILTAKSIDQNQKSTMKININVSNSEKPLPRKRGRKSREEKLRLAKLLENSITPKYEGHKNAEDTKNENLYSRPKRQYLRTICTNSKSANIDVFVGRRNTRSERLTIRDQMHTRRSLPSEVRDKEDLKISNKQEEVRNMDSGVEKKKEVPTKSRPVPVIIKQERTDTEDTPLGNAQTIKSNELVWIPHKMLAREAEKPKLPKKTELSNCSPPPGDEAEKNKISEANSQEEQHDVKHQSSMPTSTTHINVSSQRFPEQKRATVIKSAHHGNDADSDDADIIPDVLDDSCMDVKQSPGDIIKEIADDSLEINIKTDSFSEQSSRDNSFNGTKNKDGTYWKISELISDEQKEEIETYYTIDMSVVNDEEVEKNLTVIDKKNIRCNICGTLYLRMDKCQVHIWGHLKMKPYQCKACTFSTVTVSNVRCHIRKSHLKIKPFACHICEKRFVTAVLLEEHLNTHTGARPFKCKICDFASASRQMLNYHNDTHKPAKDVNCKICGKEFYSRGRLRAHVFVHHKDKVVMCKLCSTYLSNADALETHHRNIHMRDYTCNICGKQFKSRKALHNHQNVHAAAKYKCTLCPNVYKSSQILKEHILKHKGIRKYKCGVCEKAFAQQSHLAAHMAVHSEIRYHCPGCKKAFNRHDNMKIHTKRCKQFLANPELKNLLTRRERTKSVNFMRESVAHPQQKNTSDSIQNLEDHRENQAIKTVDNIEKTDINQCKLELNISCSKSARNEEWPNDIKEDVEDNIDSSEINVIPMVAVNEHFLPENGDITVLENVLCHEHF